MSENKNELARKLGLGAVIALGVGIPVPCGWNCFPEEWW